MAERSTKFKKMIILKEYDSYPTPEIAARYEEMGGKVDVMYISLSVDINF